MNPSKKSKKLLISLSLLLSTNSFANSNSISSQIENEYNNISLIHLLDYDFRISTSWRKKKGRRQEKQMRKEVTSLYSNYILANNLKTSFENNVSFQDEDVCVKYKKVTNTRLDGTLEEVSRSSKETHFSLTSAVGALAAGGLGIFPVLGVLGVAGAGGFFDSSYGSSRELLDSQNIVGQYSVSESFECIKFQKYTKASIDVVPTLDKLDKQFALKVVSKAMKLASTHIKRNINAATNYLNKIITNPVVQDLDLKGQELNGEQLKTLINNTPIMNRFLIGEKISRKKGAEAVKDFTLLLKNTIQAIFDDLIAFKAIYPTKASELQGRYDLLISKIKSFENSSIELGVGKDIIRVLDVFDSQKLNSQMQNDFSIESSISNHSRILELMEINQERLQEELRIEQERQSQLPAFEDIVRACGIAADYDSGVRICIDTRAHPKDIQACSAATQFDSGLISCLRKI
jgi:hypothetical protein